MEDMQMHDNGYSGTNFKRNVQNEDNAGQEVKLNEKTNEYLRELLSEKVKIDSAKFPYCSKLLDQEVTRVQTTGRLPPRDSKYVDVFHDKPTKVTVKVLVPTKEFPKFNFVGKLLGPKGHNLKRLQDETLCKMAILGRGSVRDRTKEEELRNGLDPKYMHLSDDLHVEISALGPPGEAHARIAYALAEVRKHLVPDPVDMMRPPMELMERRGPPRGPPPMPPMGMRPPGKSKVISILDRTRNAMEGYRGFEDPYEMPEPPTHRGHPRGQESYYGYERSQDRYYEDDSYFKEDVHPTREFKAPTREIGTRRPQTARMPGGNQRHFSRESPYSRRSTKKTE